MRWRSKALAPFEKASRVSLAAICRLGSKGGNYYAHLFAA